MAFASGSINSEMAAISVIKTYTLKRRSLAGPDLGRVTNVEKSSALYVRTAAGATAITRA